MLWEGEAAAWLRLRPAKLLLQAAAQQGPPGGRTEPAGVPAALGKTRRRSDGREGQWGRRAVWVAAGGAAGWDARRDPRRRGIACSCELSDTRRRAVRRAREEKERQPV